MTDGWTRPVLWGALAMFALLCEPAQAAKLRIGLSLPLSGAAGPLGQQFLAGARLAAETLPGAGEIEIIPVDDGCDADLAGLAAADLSTLGVDVVAGLLCNDAVAPVARALAPSGKPIIVAGARSPLLMKNRAREGWNIWRLAPGDDEAAAAAFDILASRWEGKPVAILDDGTVAGRTLADGFRERMEAAGRPVAYQDNFRPAETSQAGLAKRIERAGVQAAFVAGSAEDVAAIWSEVHGTLKPPPELAGGESLEILPWLDAPPPPPGLLAVLPVQPAGDTAARALTNQLVARNIEPEPYLYLGHASVEIALAAFRDSPQASTQALADTVFRTVIGSVDFDAEGRNLVPRYKLYRWTGRSFEPVEDAVSR